MDAKNAYERVAARIWSPQKEDVRQIIALFLSLLITQPISSIFFLFFDFRLYSWEFVFTVDTNGSST